MENQSEVFARAKELAMAAKRNRIRPYLYGLIMIAFLILIFILGWSVINRDMLYNTASYVAVGGMVGALLLSIFIRNIKFSVNVKADAVNHYVEAALFEEERYLNDVIAEAKDRLTSMGYETARKVLKTAIVEKAKFEDLAKEVKQAIRK